MFRWEGRRTVTVIAWDGKHMAGDRRRTVGGTPMPATKVRRWRTRDGTFLVGCAGDSFDCERFHDWFKSGCEGERPVATSLFALVVDSRLRCWFYAEKPGYHEITLPFFAIGSGADYAVGAMAKGASASEAASIACRFDIGCGDGVDTVCIDATTVDSFLTE